MLSRLLLAAETLKLIFLAVLRVALWRRKLTIYQHLQPTTPQPGPKIQHERPKNHSPRADAAVTSRGQIEDHARSTDDLVRKKPGISASPTNTGRHLAPTGKPGPARTAALSQNQTQRKVRISSSDRRADAAGAGTPVASTSLNAGPNPPLTATRSQI